MTNPTLEEMIAEQEASAERIWQIVNKLSYKEYRKMQALFAPVEDEEWYLHAKSKVKTTTSMNVVNAINSGSPTTNA